MIPPSLVVLLAGLLLFLPPLVRSSASDVIPTILTAADPPNCDSSSNNKNGKNTRYEALVCWLWKAQLSLPDESFREEIFTIDVKGMKCTNFRVASMASSLSTASASGADAGVTDADGTHDTALPSVQITARGISARCEGKYVVEGGIFGTSGTVVATLSEDDDDNQDKSSLHLKVDVSSKPLQDVPPKSSNSTTGKSNNNSTNDKQQKEQLPFPAKTTVSTCQPNFLVHDVQFSGSASAKVIGLFSKSIAKMVTSELNDNVCALIKQEAEDKLTKGLESARTYIGGLILKNEKMMSFLIKEAEEEEDISYSLFGPEKIPIVSTMMPFFKKKAPPKKETNFVGWDKDMPFLKRILTTLNTFMSHHLNEGLVLHMLTKLTTWSSSLSTADCRDCGFFYKGVNGLLHSLTKGTLEWKFPETFLNFHHNRTFHLKGYGDVILTAHKIKLEGMENFTDLALFLPQERNKLTSKIVTESGLNVSVLVHLAVRPDNRAVFHSDTLNELFEVHLDISKLNFTSSSAWELDDEMYGKLSVGSFIYGSYTMFDNNRNILNCLIEALKSVVILDMNGHMNLDAMHITPYVPIYEKVEGLENDLDTLINNVLKLILTEYPTTTTETVAGILQTPARNTINDGLANLIGDTKKLPLHCVNVDIPKNKSEHPLRLDSNKALQIWNEAVNDERTVEAINSFLGCIDDTLDAKKLLEGHFYNVTLGDWNVVLHDLQLENFDSVYDVKLLKPEIDHYHLTNSFGYGMCQAPSFPPDAENGDCTTMTSFAFGMNLAHTKKGNLGNINVHMKMKNLKLQAGTQLKFDMNYLPHLQIQDLLSHGQCLSIPITTFDFYGLSGSVDMLEVEIDVNLIGQNDGNTAPQSFKYETKDSTELAHVMSTLMSKGSALLKEVLGSEVMMHFHEASRVCETPVNPHRSADAKRSTGSAGVWTFLIVSAFVVGNAWLFLRGFNNKDGQGAIVASDENADEMQSEEQQESSLSEPLLNNQDEMDEILEVETPRYKFPLASSSSLMYHSSIHPAVKYGFPAILILAFILFLTSNLAIGASVDLLVTRANGSNLTSLINIYEFSLGSTMREMVNAGVYLLMVLILFCSGIWPYVKLVLMIVAWIASTRRLPPVKREKILYLLDSLGKFSLIDAYVLVLMMVAFRYNLEVEGVGELNVYVTPKYGFYSFLFATIISLVSGHTMLFLHRRSMLPHIPVYSGRYESLSKHIFDDKHGRGLVKLTKRFRRSIVFALFVDLVLICVGVGLKSFHFKFNGIAGTALGDNKTRAFSLVSIGQHIPHSVQESSSFGIHWIQTCYFFFALVMPLVCLLSMLVLFLVPMKLKQQQRAFVIAEIANAWSAIEVFVIAIV